MKILWIELKKRNLNTSKKREKKKTSIVFINTSWSLGNCSIYVRDYFGAHREKEKKSLWSGKKMTFCKNKHAEATGLFFVSTNLRVETDADSWDRCPAPPNSTSLVFFPLLFFLKYRKRKKIIRMKKKEKRYWYEVKICRPGPVQNRLLSNNFHLGLKTDRIHLNVIYNYNLPWWTQE